MPFRFGDLAKDKLAAFFAGEPLSPFAGRDSFCYVTPMQHYPVFVNPNHLRAVIVGAGEVGQRKAATLAESGAQKILCIDTAEPSSAMKELMEHPAVTFEQRPFCEDDIKGMTLAFACTGNRELNARVAELAAKHGVMSNIADAPQDGTFIVPSTVAQGSLTVAFSTGGASPAMAKRIRREMQEHFGPHYGLFLTLMERIRPKVLGLGMPTPENTKIFRELVGSGILPALAAEDTAAVTDELTNILPGDLAPCIGELLDGIC